MIDEELNHFKTNPLSDKSPLLTTGSLVKANFSLGSILLPANLDQTRDQIINSSLLINSSELKDIRFANLPNCYPALAELPNLQRDIVKLIVNTMGAAGQLAYFQSAFKSTFLWRILIEVHYIYARSKNQVNFHKDTEGQTLFVNLLYMNDQKIAGPDYILNPPPIKAHDEATEGKQPAFFVQDLSQVRKTLGAPTYIEESEIPAYGYVAFVDEAIHHSTPVYGHRKVSPRELNEYLKQTRLGEFYAWWESEYKKCLKLEATDKDNLIKSKPVFNWLHMALAKPENGPQYSRIELAAAGFSEKEVDEIIDRAYNSGLVTVSTPLVDDRVPIFPSPRTRLRRRRSEGDIGRIAEPTSRRSFFRTWVKAVRIWDLPPKYRDGWG